MGNDSQVFCLCGVIQATRPTVLYLFTKLHVHTENKLPTEAQVAKMQPRCEGESTRLMQDCHLDTNNCGI